MKTETRADYQIWTRFAGHITKQNFGKPNERSIKQNKHGHNKAYKNQMLYWHKSFIFLYLIEFMCENVYHLSRLVNPFIMACMTDAH